MDIGYACSTKLGAPLLYGNSTRQAPCVVQTEGVQWVVRVFFMFLPGICYLLCCIPLKYMRIGPKEHAAIVAGTVARYKGGKVKDPLSNEMVEAISSVDRTIALEHFSEWEQRKASEFGLSFLYKGEEYVGAALLVGICEFFTLYSLSLTPTIALNTTPYESLRSHGRETGPLAHPVPHGDRGHGCGPLGGVPHLRLSCLQCAARSRPLGDAPPPVRGREYVEENTWKRIS